MNAANLIAGVPKLPTPVARTVIAAWNAKEASQRHSHALDACELSMRLFAYQIAAFAPEQLEKDADYAKFTCEADFGTAWNVVRSVQRKLPKIPEREPVIAFLRCPLRIESTSHVLWLQETLSARPPAHDVTQTHLWAELVRYRNNQDAHGGTRTPEHYQIAANHLLALLTDTWSAWIEHVGSEILRVDSVEARPDGGRVAHIVTLRGETPLRLLEDDAASRSAVARPGALLVRTRQRLVTLGELALWHQDRFWVHDRMRGQTIVYLTYEGGERMERARPNRPFGDAVEMGPSAVHVSGRDVGAQAAARTIARGGPAEGQVPLWEEPSREPLPAPPSQSRRSMSRVVVAAVVLAAAGTIAIYQLSRGATVGGAKPDPSRTLPVPSSTGVAEPNYPSTPTPTLTPENGASDRGTTHVPSTPVERPPLSSNSEGRAAEARRKRAADDGDKQ